MRISDWSSDVCSSDLDAEVGTEDRAVGVELERQRRGADAAHDLHALEDADVAVARGAGAGIAGGDAHAPAGVERVVDVVVLDDAGGDRQQGPGRVRSGRFPAADIAVLRIEQTDAVTPAGAAGVGAPAPPRAPAARG